MVNTLKSTPIISVMEKKIDDQKEAEIIDSYRILLTERIVRNIAHEVRNPLTNVMLGLDQLRNEFPSKDNEGVDIYFSIIKRNCDRINELISSLVNSAKPSELVINDHSINKLIDDALLVLEEKIKSGKITIKKNYTEKIPPLAVDGEKIKVAFSNIISNAINAMEEKAGILEIETAIENDKCMVKFKDNGIGISNENISRIFDPFFRVKSHGPGLGLTTTQNIVNNHKGIIKVNSALCIGTTFTVSFML